MNSPAIVTARALTRAFCAAIVTVCVSATSSALRAEPMSAADARELLRQAGHDEPHEPGSYRQTVDRDTKFGHVTQNTLLLVTPDHRAFSRVERSVSVANKPAQNRQIVTLTTPEGRWFVYREAAVLEPIANIEPLLATARRIVDTPAASEAAVEQLKREHPYLAAALEIERHGQYARDTAEKYGRSVVLITETYDADGRRALDALSDRLFAEAKASFGFAKRLLINAYVGLTNVPAKLPASYAFEIDATTGRLLATTVTTVGGESRVQRSPNRHFIPAAPLSQADFALPKAIPQFRPKTQAEFIQLQHRYEVNGKN